MSIAFEKKKNDSDGNTILKKTTTRSFVARRGQKEEEEHQRKCLKQPERIWFLVSFNRSREIQFQAREREGKTNQLAQHYLNAKEKHENVQEKIH